MSPTNPLRVMFLVTSMPVGGAETLLVNLVRRLDRSRFKPEVACLKERGPLGEELACEVPVHCGLTVGKFDLRVLPRLVSLMRARRVDAIVTVGAGDKMFWGRLAAKIARVPVITSALHSTGWPDGVGRLNRLLTPLTDAFIGVAKPHGQHLVEREKFPADRVHVIPNGVDTERFSPAEEGLRLREEIGASPTSPVVGILAALRPEKNHELFLQAAAEIHRQFSDAHFVVIGDGPRREALEVLAIDLGIANAVHFLGNRCDVPTLLAGLDVVALTSHNEANPVSILEAMSVGKPVVATDVGSVHETVDDGVTGYLVPEGEIEPLVNRLMHLLCEPIEAAEMGARGREVVKSAWSLEAMVGGYERLLTKLYQQKTGRISSSTVGETPVARDENEAEVIGAAHS